MPLVNDLYRKVSKCSRGSGGVGGHLHIVLDDGNVEDGSVQFCVNEATKDRCETCCQLALKLLTMSPTQRRRLYREHSI